MKIFSPIATDSGRLFSMTEPVPREIEAILATYTPSVRDALLECRTLIFSVAMRHGKIGPITETLKWGHPAYLTEASKAGSTLRLGPCGTVPRAAPDSRAALYVNCKTDLIEQFRVHYPETFVYQGNRGLVLKRPVETDADALSHCIALTLMYHLRKRSKLGT